MEGRILKKKTIFLCSVFLFSFVILCTYVHAKDMDHPDKRNVRKLQNVSLHDLYTNEEKSEQKNDEQEKDIRQTFSSFILQKKSIDEAAIKKFKNKMLINNNNFLHIFNEIQNPNSTNKNINKNINNSTKSISIDNNKNNNANNKIDDFSQYNSSSSLPPFYSVHTLAHHFDDWLFNGTSGLCRKNSTYNITSELDLKNYLNELECIYARGNAPARPPVGIWYGNVLNLLGTNVFNFIVAALWTGKLALLGKCKSNVKKFYNIVYNFVNDELTLPALMYIGYLRNNTVTDANFDKKKHLFVDYTINFNDVCPVNQRVNPNLKFELINDPFPFNQIVDLVRCVGRTEDGGYLLLGKSLLRDGYQFPNVGDSELAFWSVVNYDDSSFPDPSVCQLQNLEADFEFKHAGGIDAFSRFIMLDDLLKDPVETILKYIDIHIRRPLGLPPLSKSLKYVYQHYPTAGVYTETIPYNLYNNKRSFDEKANNYYAHNGSYSNAHRNDSDHLDNIFTQLYRNAYNYSNNYV